MTRIICDTMIWYDLSKNKLQIPDPTKYSLVCTYLSLMELAFTPNSFNNLEEVQEVIRIITEIKPELLMKYPTDYAISLIDPDYNQEYDREEDLVLAFLRVLLNHPKEGLISNEFKDQLSHIASSRRKNSSDWAEFLNDLYQPSKRISHLVKKYYGNELNSEYIRKLFVNALNQSSRKTYSEENINWSNFEFYEKVHSRYMRNLYLTKMKADRNDVNDIKNMIYVQPIDKYWTLEKRWLTIIKEIKLENYLYLPK